MPPEPKPAPEPGPPPAVVAEAVTGVAFGPPRIGLPGATRGVTPPPTPVMAPPPSAMLAQMMQAQAAREAGRAQITDALQRTLGESNAGTAEGACALQADPPAHLACDNDSLMTALAPREEALSGLLRAYRSMEPRTRGLTIAVVQGRYQVAWSVND